MSPKGCQTKVKELRKVVFLHNLIEGSAVLLKFLQNTGFLLVTGHVHKTADRLRIIEVILYYSFKRSELIV